MSDIPEQSRAVATKPQAQAVTSAMAFYDTDKFTHMQRMATALQNGTMLPAAVRGSHPDECFSNLLIVFDMAERLRTTPMAVAQSISMVHGKMVLEGKLVNAAISNVLSVTLYPWWVGKRGSDDYRIYLSDKPWDTGDEEKDMALIAQLSPGVSMLGRRVIDGSVGEWKTFDKSKQPMPAWQGVQTQNQLLYRGTREWARRWEPAIMLGVYTDDEITGAEERGAARASTATVSLSALSTGFASDPKPDPIEDAVVEDLPNDTAPTGEDLQKMDDAFEGYEAAKKKADLEDKENRIALEMDDEKDKKPARKPRGNKADKATPKQGTTTAQADKEAMDLAHATEEQAKAGDDEGTPQPEDPGHVDGSNDSAQTINDDDAFPMKAPSECPVDRFMIDLADMRDWETIKAALVKVSSTDAWAILDPRDQKVIRKEVWIQMDILITGGHTKFDFLNDLSAFRCWLEWYGEEDGILGNWDVLVSMDHFANLDADSQKRLQSAVTARITELRGGVH